MRKYINRLILWTMLPTLGAPVFGGAVDSEIVLTIDVSPSISAAELAIEKAGLHDCVNNPQIVPQDGSVAVGIVTYADVATDILGLTPVTPQNLANIINPAINNIMRAVNAQTNITAGLLHARAILEGPASQTENDFILLAGDGAHNTGNPEPETTCPQVRNAGITICSIAIDASQAGENDLESCANPPMGQFGVAETFSDFEPVCVACLSFFLDVECEGPTVCNDPGTCVGTIPCEDIAVCEAPPGTPIERECTPSGPYPRGTSSVEVVCTANMDVVEEVTCTVTVNDCEDPEITCPPNAMIDCDGSTHPSDTGVATATDNCDASPAIMISNEQTVPSGCSGGFVLSRTWKATDSSGNMMTCTQTITAVDSADPELNCPSVVDLLCTNPGGVPSDSVDFDVFFSDDCDTNLMVTDDRPEGFFPPTCGSNAVPTIVTFTVTDGCGNTATCEVPVFVTGQACCPTFIEADTDLTLLPVDQNFRQDHEGPITTKAKFDIWNSNEVRFSGTERCITCWDQTLLSAYEMPNHFFIDNLQTDKGKARIDGIPSPVVCVGGEGPSVASPLLGLSLRDLKYIDSDRAMRTGTTLVGIGGQPAQIVYDPATPPDDEFSPPATDKDFENFLFRSRGEGMRIYDERDDTPTDPQHAATGPLEENLAGTSKKGSLLYWVKIELKWDAGGALIQDTFVTLLNDNIGDVHIKLYQVNGDEPLDAVIHNGQILERAHAGWNNSDIEIVLTSDQATYWSAGTGQPAGVSPFWVLDAGNPPGRPDHDADNPGGRVLRGFLVGWAINEDGDEIRWNHLEGKAVLVNYRDATAAEYDAWSFQCISEALTGDPCDSVPQQLNMDGVEYEAPPERLLLDFFATGSRAFSPPGAKP